MSRNVCHIKPRSNKTTLRYSTIVCNNMAETRKYKPLGETNRKVKLLIALLVLTCLALLIAVIILAVSLKKQVEVVKSSEEMFCPASGGSSHKGTRKLTAKSENDMYRDLSLEEFARVRDYLLADSKLNLTQYSKATGLDNYIYIIELMNPDKDEALAFLDDGGTKPVRQARAIIFAGARNPPIVQEFLVPVDKPEDYTEYSPGSKHPIPYRNRPWGAIEMDALQGLVNQFTLAASDVMWESFQMNCSSSPCSTNFPALPIVPDDFSFWVRLYRPVNGPTSVPLPVELFILSDGSDSSFWKIGKVLYNNLVFDSLDSFLKEYRAGKVAKVLQPAKPMRNMYSDMHRRGDIKPDTDKVEPTLYDRGGKRYTTDENHVEYLGWSFDFRVRTTSGLQLFDVKFNGSRIIYELSLQEASAFYGGYSPTSLFANYLDIGWSIGRTFELAKSIDCPEAATYFDVLSYADSDGPRNRRNGLCVYELSTGAPFRRHFQYEGAGKYASYAGMPTTALVLRTIMVPYNYDYVFDYIFYPNGVIEVKGTSMGYIISSFWDSKEGRFGNRVQQDVAGPVHDHMFNFKVDLDIVGRKNSFELIRSKIEKTTRWLDNGNYHYARYIEREQKKTEKEAAYTYNFQTPTYLNVYNAKEKNSFGVRRGYRIQLNGVTKQMYPSNWSFTNALHWSDRQVVVTKYKSNETRSSSIYNQMDFHDPVIDFNDYIEDDDDISNEDLVTWITVGLMHLPHSEDIPITAGVGTSAGFYLRPFNYFDEDPSVSSRDTVVITPNGEKSKVERSKRAARDTCIPRSEPIAYLGNLE